MQPDTLSHTFAALADPTRRAILSRLLAGPASVGELAAPFDISLPAVSRHLRVLSDAGLIVRQKDAQWRRCSLAAGPLREAADWIEHYRPFWEQSFDRLDAHLARRTGRATRHEPSPTPKRRKPAPKPKEDT